MGGWGGWEVTAGETAAGGWAVAPAVTAEGQARAAVVGARPASRTGCVCVGEGRRELVWASV